MNNEPLKCYQCKLFDIKKEHHPFCSELCHTTWADKNYPKKDMSSLKEKLKRWK